MGKGLQGFVGRRLEEARLARGLTQTSLAQLVGRDSSTISAWEGGRQSPDWDAVQALSSVLNVRPLLFLKEADTGGNSYYFRSNASITVGLQKKSKSIVKWASLICQEIEEWIDFTDPSFPLSCAASLDEIDDAVIEDMAEKCRDRWGLGQGPIDNVVSVLESAGAIVVRAELGGQKMDGVSVWGTASFRPFVFLAEDKASAVRSRFDASHELGHIVLHTNIDAEKLNRAEYAELERQAHRFASAFLMPSKSFSRDVRRVDLDGFVALKARWGVSIGAMIMRCAQIDIIDEEYKQRMFKYMSSRGWRKAEPLDDTMLAERPTALSEAIRLVLDAGKYTRDGLLDAIGLNAFDVETIANLPRGFLQREAAPVVQLRPANS